MSISTTNTQHLIRANLYSTHIKEAFDDELMAMKWVNMIDDFPDGDTLNIPSIGQAEVSDYAEGRSVTYTSFDTGNYTFTITEYKQTGYYITNKMKQDSYIFNQVAAKLGPKMHRALAKQMEVDALAKGPEEQTASNLNTINGGNHRFIASGTGESMTLKEFSLANYALNVVDAPMTNLVAIVDPSVVYTFETSVTLSNAISATPTWDRVMKEGMVTGSRFAFSVMGWDVYVSQNLKKNVNETIDSKTSASGVANIFMSVGEEVGPLVGNIRQAPDVDSEYNKDEQREEYVATSRYGFGLYRPETLVTVITDTDVVS